MAYLNHDFHVDYYEFSSTEVEAIIEAAMPSKGSKPDFETLIFENSHQRQPVRARLALRSLLNAASLRYFVALDSRGHGPKAISSNQARVVHHATALLNAMGQDIDGEGISNWDPYFTLLSGSFGDAEDDRMVSTVSRFPDFCDSLRLLIFKMNLVQPQLDYPNRSVQLMADLKATYELLWLRKAGISRDLFGDEGGPFLRFLQRTYSVISDASSSSSALAGAFRQHKREANRSLIISVTNGHSVATDAEIKERTTKPEEGEMSPIDTVRARYRNTLLSRTHRSGQI